jgi:hypothetical protein
MDQSPTWENNWSSDSQETTPILWNQKCRHRIHKTPPPVPILCQINTVYTPTSHFLNFHLTSNTIFPSTPGYARLSLPFTFPHHNLVYTSPLPHVCYMSHPSHSSIFDYTNNILKHPQPTLLPQCERPSFTSIQKRQAELYLCISQSLYFSTANWKANDSAPNDSKHSLTSICS